MANSIFEKMLKIKQVRINVNRAWTISIGKAVLKQCNLKESDFVRLLTYKNKLVIQKVNIKDIIKIK